MPYVSRNEQGEVDQLLDAPSGDKTQWLEINDPDVEAFLQGSTNKAGLKQSLVSSDAEMARVVEDLVDMLMEKQVFVFTELPEVVQTKLNARKRLRRDVNEISNLISEDDNVL